MRLIVSNDKAVLVEMSGYYWIIKYHTPPTNGRYFEGKWVDADEQFSAVKFFIEQYGKPSWVRVGVFIGE